MKKVMSIILLFVACEHLPDNKAGVEIFNEKNEPAFEYFQEDKYYLCKPWNYDEDWNKNRTYPLVVKLHGGGGAGDPCDLFHLGKDGFANLKKTYLCFIYAAQTSGSWNNTLLIDQIEKLKNSYRIDTNRIYLIGYSMGGSGSYSLANAYYDFNKHLFAGIIRLAGQSQPSVRDAIAKRTSIWLHIGLKDTERRIRVTRQAYDYIKNYYPNVSEESERINIVGHPGTTLTLTKNHIEILKKTEYDNDGHAIYNFPYHNNNFFKWLFTQSLQYRK